MKVMFQTGVVFVSGRIETDVLDDLRAALTNPAHVRPTAGKDAVHLDTSGVTRINSLGLLGLKNALVGAHPPPIVHVRMPYVVFRECSLVPLLRPQDDVERLVLPMTSPRSTRDMEFRVGQDIPLLPDYAQFTLRVDVDGETFELDADSEHLFRPLVQRGTA